MTDTDLVVVFGPDSAERCEQFLDDPPNDVKGRELFVGARSDGSYVVVMEQPV